MKRRDLIKNLSMLPVAGAAGSLIAAEVKASPTPAAKRNLLKSWASAHLLMRRAPILS